VKPGPISEVAFTPAVKAEQQRMGSRAAYARMETGAGWETAVTPELADFIAERNSLYLGTASALGQPYIQHRGGPRGFVHVLDPHTLAFADDAGNRQYITLGNLAENDRAFLFFMDYARRQRIKLWGRARCVEGDAALSTSVATPGARARVERVLVFSVEAWDANCPQHIPRLVDAEDAGTTVEELRRRIAELEAENQRLRRAP
jgi:predicted pyridoxine 5'-phosphate oxidase superfamily flavin-nucleotide-binding protein